MTNFNREFKRIVGRSPTQFRELLPKQVGQFPFGSTQSGCAGRAGCRGSVAGVGCKSGFRQAWQRLGKVSECARDGATFTLERTRGTFRTLAVQC